MQDVKESRSIAAGSGRAARRTGTTLVAAALALGVLGALASPAAAKPRPGDSERPVPKAERLRSDPVQCGTDDLQVPEYSTRILGSTWIYPGKSVRVTAGGSVWAGVWFTGSNGPDGWSGSRADASFPVPGAPVYGLVGKLGNDPWRHLGSGPVTLTNTSTDRIKKVVLRVNDSAPGNGSGAFWADVAYPCTGG